MANTDWAAALFPQHTRHSGAAAVIDAADNARAEMQRQLAAERDTAVLNELDRIDQADQHQWGKDW